MATARRADAPSVVLGAGNTAAAAAAAVVAAAVVAAASACGGACRETSAVRAGVFVADSLMPGAPVARGDATAVGIGCSSPRPVGFSAFRWALAMRGLPYPVFASANLGRR